MTSTTPTLLVVNHLGDWACRWDRLVDASPLPSPFLRSWWLAGTASHRARFLLVVQNDQLLGGVALEQGRRLGLPCLRLMGAGPLCPDHLDLLATPGEEEAVVKAIESWLSRRGTRLVDFEGVVSDSRLIRATPGSVRRESIAVAPWTPIPADGNTYIDARPALFRRNLRRATARLAASGATHRANRGSTALQRLDALRRLHDAQWGKRSNFLPSFDSFAASCHLAADFDEIAVHELVAGQTVGAILVAFEVGQRVSLYQSARLTDNRWREASTVLLAAVVSEACERGFTEVDFLRGDEAYKRNLASHRREVVRLRAATGWLGQLALRVDTVARKAKPAAARAAHWRPAKAHRQGGSGQFADSTSAPAVSAAPEQSLDRLPGRAAPPASGQAREL